MELTHVRFLADARELAQDYGSVFPRFGVEYPDSKCHTDQTGNDNQAIRLTAPSHT